METPPKRRRVPLLLAGGAAALAAGLGVAGVLTLTGGRDRTAPPASQAGLVIDPSGTGEGHADPGKPLRCFVQGQFVGELSLTDCARRNGVATDALDVGLDESGALAAADQAGQTLTPLPPEDVPPEAAEEATAAAEQSEAASEADVCWRYGGGRWKRVNGPADLNACVQTLFAGRCERAGAADYGRWDQQTLRLVSGRVEISDDNRTFRTLVVQAPDCALPPVE